MLVDNVLSDGPLASTAASNHDDNRLANTAFQKTAVYQTACTGRACAGFSGAIPAADNDDDRSNGI
jgi:hypothetical protein